jgi:hypothetical protein
MNEQLEAIKFLEFIIDNKTVASKKEFVDAQKAIEILKKAFEPKTEPKDYK